MPRWFDHRRRHTVGRAGGLRASRGPLERAQSKGVRAGEQVVLRRPPNARFALDQGPQPRLGHVPNGGRGLFRTGLRSQRAGFGAQELHALVRVLVHHLPGVERHVQHGTRPQVRAALVRKWRRRVYARGVRVLAPIPGGGLSECRADGRRTPVSEPPRDADPLGQGSERFDHGVGARSHLPDGAVPAAVVPDVRRGGQGGGHRI